MKYDRQFPGVGFLSKVRRTSTPDNIVHYQANTARDRVVLSTIFLGLTVIDDPPVSLRFTDVIAAINTLHETLQKHSQDGSV